MKVFLSLFIFLCILPFSHAVTKANDAEGTFKKAGQAVFQIITAAGAHAPKRSYGSSFVIDKKQGLLITNYHVVATVLQDMDKNYSVFLIKGDQTHPLKILAIDIINDLALIQSTAQFDVELSLAKKEPKQGENIFSLGLPRDLNLSIIQGVYNNVVKYAAYEQIHISSPLNAGMSGGPTLNTAGEVIGVNVATMRWSQDISFSVPGRHIQKLWDEQKTNPKQNLEANIDGVIETQLNEIQKQLLSDLKNFPNEQKSFIGTWHFAPPSKSTKCWGQKTGSIKSLSERESQSCRINHVAYLDDDRYTGTYSISSTVITNKSEGSFRFFEYLTTIFNGERDLTLFRNQDDSYKIDSTPVYSIWGNSDSLRLLTKYSCNESIVVNSNEVPMKVLYCLRAYTRYKDINIFKFKILTLLKEKEVLFLEGEFDGVTKKTTEEFLSYQINSIRRSK